MLIMDRDSKEGETEVFSNEKMKITIVMKKFDNPNLFNVLFRYYSLTETALTDFSLNVRFDKTITNTTALIMFTHVHSILHRSTFL